MRWDPVYWAPQSTPTVWEAMPVLSGLEWLRKGRELGLLSLGRQREVLPPWQSLMARL